MILWHYDFPNFPGGDPPDPLNERGKPPLILSPLAANAAHIMPSASYAPPYSSLLGPALIICLSTKLSSLLVETKLYKNTRGKDFISNFRPYKSTHTDNVT